MTYGSSTCSSERFEMVSTQSSAKKNCASCKNLHMLEIPHGRDSDFYFGQDCSPTQNASFASSYDELVLDLLIDSYLLIPDIQVQSAQVAVLDMKSFYVSREGRAHHASYTTTFKPEGS